MGGSCNDCTDVCTTEYNPVCARNGKTYSNTCEMEKDGQTKLYDGTCNGNIPRSGFNNCYCTKEYKPVCGKDGITYKNKCHLKCWGEQMDYEGICRRGAKKITEENTSNDTIIVVEKENDFLKNILNSLKNICSGD